jgi:hypothetical protein
MLLLVPGLRYLDVFGWRGAGAEIFGFLMGHFGLLFRDMLAGGLGRPGCRDRVQLTGVALAAVDW